MVSGVYDARRFEEGSVDEEEMTSFVSTTQSTMRRLHAMVLGPGLGRNEHVLTAASRIVEVGRKTDVPLVLDADGIYVVMKKPEIVRGYGRAVLTPNAHEYRLLARSLELEDDVDVVSMAKRLDGPVVLRKGPIDEIARPGMTTALRCDTRGSPRRPGGLGDVLAGTTAVLLSWALRKGQCPAMACRSACSLVRNASARAYGRKRRAMIAMDLLDDIGPAFESACPSPSYP